MSLKLNSVALKTNAMFLRSLLFLFLIVYSSANLKAQNKHIIDSLMRELATTKDPDLKFAIYQQLSLFDEPKKKYKSNMLLNAELSGNTELQLRTYNLVAQLAEDSAQFYLDKMFALAKEKRNEEYQGWYYLSSALMQYTIKNNAQKALEFAREANSIAVSNHFDSLAYEVNRMTGFIHNDKGERLLEYKSYMLQLSLAEKINGGRLALGTYWQIFWFYNNLKHFSKAKEYAFKILEKGQKKDWPDWIEGGHHLLTHYYTNVGEFETAKYYYDETNKLRKENNSLVSEDDDLLDIYSNAKDYLKMLHVLQKDDIRKSSLQRDTSGYDYYGQIAYCYTKLGIADSAFYFLQKMKDAGSSKEMRKWAYYSYLGDYYKLINNVDSAAINYSKADSGFAAGNNLMARIERYANLDTLFSRKGNYEKAYFYKTLWMQYKDSAAALSKDGDLVVLEIENENQRMETERRASHNIQYMGITAGLASVFILLVLLGVFSSGTAIIRGLSFFAFIFFFEFLILLFDNAIHQFTHGEPWKILSIKIVLIAMLLPLHHYVEHKVVHHLLHRKKVSLLKWRKVPLPIPTPLADKNEDI